MADTPGEEPARERWLFAGSVIDAKRSRSHRWIDANGEELTFRARGSHALGGYYMVRCSRNGDGVSLYADVRFTGDRVSGDQWLEIRARHDAAEVALATIAAERKLGGEDPIAEALEPIMRLARRLTPNQRTALAAKVIRLIEKGY